MPKAEKRRFQRSQGFTFLELMIALVVFAAIAATIQASLRTGILVSRRGQEAGRERRVAYTALDLMARHIRGIEPLEFPEAVFNGESGRLSFPARIVSSEPGDSPRRAIGLMSFYLESGTEEGKNRLVWERRLLTEATLSGRERLMLLEPVDELAFLYAGYAEESEEAVGVDPSSGEQALEWVSEWTRETVPLGIRIMIVFPDPQNGEPVEIVHTLYPETGGLLFSALPAPLIPIGEDALPDAG